MPLTTLNITSENITGIANIVEPTDFLINVNWIVYGGWLVFILLMLTWFVLFMTAQEKEDQPIPNLTLSGAIISILAVFLRFIFLIVGTEWRGLITESQFWIFPVITIILAMISYSTKE